MNYFAPQPRREISDDGRLRLSCPAKINLNLLVGARREDGFHPLDSYVSMITFYDHITLNIRDDGQIVFICDGFECGCDERNLALRAGRMLCERFGGSGAEIKLDKRIPPGKGLGGGSCDAATVLWGLNELWRLELCDEELIRLGASLGSDVPLFLGPAASRMTGRGEFIERVEIHPFWAVLWIGEAFCATVDVYQAYDEGNVVMEKQFDQSLLAKPPSSWRGLLRNQLDESANAVNHQLRRVRQRLEASELPVCMTGSGSAMFILCDSRDEAAEVLNRLDEDLKRDCIVVQSETAGNRQ